MASFNYIKCISWISVMMTPISLTTAVKIGIICDTSPDSWQYLFGVASAINIARDKLVSEGIIKNNTINR